MIRTHKFPNGLTLLVEKMARVSSCAMSWLVPGGLMGEPHNRQGLGAVLSEMLWRGAGDRDARAHTQALEQLGVDRSSSVGAWHVRIGATLLADRLNDALPLLADAVLRPHLSEASLEPARQLALQELTSLNDEPQDKLMVELRRLHLGDPLGRSSLGREEDLLKLSIEDVREHHRRWFGPRQSVLACAGPLEFEELRDRIGLILENWAPQSETLPVAAEKLPAPAVVHVPSESAQVHIGLACPAVAEPDALSMTQRLALGVLSGGMSGRLFTEVRENRGLCYSVFATYAGRPAGGSLLAYAGTTPQRADETLSVLLAELEKISKGVSEEEFARARIGLRSSLVMQGESTAARAAGLAQDQFLRGQSRTLEEIDRQITAVSLKDLNAFLTSHPTGPWTRVTVGPRPPEAGGKA